MILIVMGVCGSGKTTVGLHLANDLHWPFADADEFHPKSNIDKMAAGLALDDEDRLPWLTGIREYINRLYKEGSNGVVTCSALKAHYRRLLVDGVWECPATTCSPDNSISSNLPSLGESNSEEVPNGFSHEDPLNNNCFKELAHADNKDMNHCGEVFSENGALRSELNTGKSLSSTGSDIRTKESTSDVSASLNIYSTSPSSTTFLTTYSSTKSYIGFDDGCAVQSNGRAVQRLPAEHSKINSAVYSDGTTVCPASQEFNDNIGDTLSTQALTGSSLRAAASSGREQISADDILFVYLKGSCDVIETRMKQRTGHFMPMCLLQSQLETLEEPSAAENSLSVNIGWSVEKIGERVKQYIHKEN